MSPLTRNFLGVMVVLLVGFQLCSRLVLVRTRLSHMESSMKNDQ